MTDCVHYKHLATCQYYVTDTDLCIIKCMLGQCQWTVNHMICCYAAVDQQTNRPQVHLMTAWGIHWHLHHSSLHWCHSGQQSCTSTLDPRHWQSTAMIWKSPLARLWDYSTKRWKMNSLTSINQAVGICTDYRRHLVNTFGRIMLAGSWLINTDNYWQ